MTLRYLQRDDRRPMIAKTTYRHLKNGRIPYIDLRRPFDRKRGGKRGARGGQERQRPYRHRKSLPDGWVDAGIAHPIKKSSEREGAEGEGGREGGEPL